MLDLMLMRKENKMLRTKWFDCECSDSDHAVRFVWFDEDDNFDSEIYINTQMNPAHRWYERLWIAVLYVFGIKKRHWNHFQDTVLSMQQVEELVQFLKGILDDRRKN